MFVLAKALDKSLTRLSIFLINFELFLRVHCSLTGRA